MISASVGVRIFAPLIISKEMMGSGIEILELTIKEVKDNRVKTENP